MKGIPTFVTLFLCLATLLTTAEASKPPRKNGNNKKKLQKQQEELKKKHLNDKHKFIFFRQPELKLPVSFGTEKCFHTPLEAFNSLVSDDQIFDDQILDEVLRFRSKFANPENLEERTEFWGSGESMAKKLCNFMEKKHVEMFLLDLQYADYDKVLVCCVVERAVALIKQGKMTATELLEILLKGMVKERTERRFESVELFWKEGFDVLKNPNPNFYHSIKFETSLLSFEDIIEIRLLIDLKTKDLNLVGTENEQEIIFLINVEDHKSIRKRTVAKIMNLLFYPHFISRWLKSYLLIDPIFEKTSFDKYGFLTLAHSPTPLCIVERVVFINDSFQRALDMWHKHPQKLANYLFYQVDTCPDELKAYKESPELFFNHILSCNVNIKQEFTILFKARSKSNLPFRNEFLKSLETFGNPAFVIAYLENIDVSANELNVMVFKKAQYLITVGLLNPMEFAKALVESLASAGKEIDCQLIKKNISPLFLQFLMTDMQYQTAYINLVLSYNSRFKCFENNLLENIKEFDFIIAALLSIVDEDSIEFVLRRCLVPKTLALSFRVRFFFPYSKYTDSTNLLQTCLKSSTFAYLDTRAKSLVLMDILKNNPHLFTRSIWDLQGTFTIEHYAQFWKLYDYSQPEINNVVFDHLEKFCLETESEEEIHLVLTVLATGQEQKEDKNTNKFNSSSNSAANNSSSLSAPLGPPSKSYPLEFVQNRIHKLFKAMFKSQGKVQILFNFLTKPFLALEVPKSSPQFKVAVNLLKLIDFYETSAISEMLQNGSLKYSGNQLGTFKMLLSEAENERLSQDDMCPVCFEQREKLVTYRCRHKLCVECDEGLRIRRCPLCNLDLTLG